MPELWGEPVWTEGGFGRAAAIDDLGIESTGAGLLRRFLPGIVETTPNAGYYSLYPYVVARWEDASSSVKRTDFRPFFRRHEAAYALACVLHDHRGRLIGVNGSSKSAEALSSSSVDVARYAEPDVYMQSAYGGYGLFYARVIAELRLTHLGAPGLIDKVTDRGRAVAEAFATVFEATEYFRAFQSADVVPVDVLRELGEAVCLCSVPGRADHDLLLDAFFGQEEDSPEWDERRVTRMRSLGMFLEYHNQRPADRPGDIAMWRRSLLSKDVPDGFTTETRFREHRDLWRAYQVREILVMALTSLWSSCLELLDSVQPASRQELVELAAKQADWVGTGLEETLDVSEAIDTAEGLLPTDDDLVREAEFLERPQASTIGERLARSFRLALAIVPMTEHDGSAFDELLDEGSDNRWSLSYHRTWVATHKDETCGHVLSALLAALFVQHQRVATGKLSPTDHRDPFNVADDDGLLSVVRLDDPFWTGARYGVVNHLLWTLGALSEPVGDPRTTDLGLVLLERCLNA